MVLTPRSSLDMQDAAHTMMISNIAIKCLLKGLSLRDIDMRNSFKTFCGGYQDLIVKYPRSGFDIIRDSFSSDTYFKWIVTF